MSNGERGPQVSPVGTRVGLNVHRVRRDRGLHLRELSAELADIGRPIGVGQLSKLEQGQRRVDVDDLVALAIVLDVTPAQLLMPDPYEPQAAVQLTPTKATSEFRAWQWLCGDLWLENQQRPPTNEAEVDWYAASRPHDFTGVYNFDPGNTRGHEASVRQLVTAARSATAAGMSPREVVAALSWYLAVSPQAPTTAEEATGGEGR